MWTKTESAMSGRRFSILAQNPSTILHVAAERHNVQADVDLDSGLRWTFVRRIAEGEDENKEC